MEASTFAAPSGYPANPMVEGGVDLASRWDLSHVAFDRLAKIPEELHFAAVKTYIFNQFRNRQPHVYNYDYFFLGRNNIRFHASVICDSNIASLLHRRVSQADRLTAEKFTAAQELLKTFLLNDVDYNSFFYLLEASAKVTLGDYQDLARGVEESFLLLHSMDRERFLATGEIVPSISRRHLYQDEFDATDFSDFLQQRFERVAHGTTIPQCDFLYAGLLEAI
jgi:hypothetical protein